MTRVLLFGRLADLAGWRERTIDPPPGRLSELQATLAAGHPALGAALVAPGVRAAVDKVLCRGDPLLSSAAEVAFMPPMSGG
jgi:molybdopterin synthase sulfur carrier subunit